MESKKYIFYFNTHEKVVSVDASLENGYNFIVFKPGFIPKGIKNKTLFFWCIVWSVFHYLRIFKSRNYRIFLIYYRNDIAHYSVAMPKYFRSPFMSNNDIQIGPIGTDKNHRRKGLANFAIKKIIEHYNGNVSGFWYITRDENIASKKCIENFGFKAYGEGKKTGLLKKYIIEKKYD